MELIHQIIRSVLPDFTEAKACLDFQSLAIDSFDLMTIRVALEQRLGRGVPDELWVTFTNFQDILDFYGAASCAPPPDVGGVTGLERRVVVNMPHMAVGGLAESWLFRELGDMHWTSICDALGSHRIQLPTPLAIGFTPPSCAFGGRVLTTSRLFRRMRSCDSAATYRDTVASMYFSDCTVANSYKHIQASLMSTFALRESDNTSLLKGEPTIPDASLVRVEPELPDFAHEYRQMRSERKRDLELAGRRLTLGRQPLCQLEYRLNPYHDFNGVNLLYFAAYPTITDICEREFVHRNRALYPVTTDWSLESSTLSRDVFYYANCNIDDSFYSRSTRSNYILARRRS